MSDLINREFTIGVLLVGCKSVEDLEDDYGCGYDDGLRYAIHKIKHIPPAESEIIHCENCRYHDSDGFCYDSARLTLSDDYCSFGKENTDE